MEFTARQVAEMLGGNLEGDPEVRVNKLAKIEEGEPASITFLSNKAYHDFLYTTRASVAIVAGDFEPVQTLPPTLTLIRVVDPRVSFGKLLEAYQQIRFNRSGIETPNTIHPTAKIDDHTYVGAHVYIGADARIGKHVRIFPNCYIGENVHLGDHTTLMPGAVVHHDCEIGAHCTLHSGVIIGGDGFGFAPNSTNNYQKVVHIGNVIIEDHVEIGSGTTIDRGTLGSTRICRGVKLDNLIQIGHNVEIGENTVMAAQCGVAGSAKIGRNCMIGGQVGIVGHISIADEVKIAAQSGIGNTISEKGSIWQGSPALPVRDYQRAYVVFRNLEKLQSTLNSLIQQRERN
jgi:UDP-3-O-[3-hydroxymyristoyl] glucosamine N-acyltransferase